MNIKILGAHNCESQGLKFACILIDDVLVIDAGGLTSTLSFAAQLKLKSILITHHHYDHIRDIPALGMNLYLNQTTINIYATQSVYDVLTTHLLNGNLYPNFLEMPSQALLMALAWQKAPAATVRVIIAPPMISDHLKSDVLAGSRVVS